MQRYVAEDYDFVVDIDPEKFFDRINHARLLARVAARVPATARACRLFVVQRTRPPRFRPIPDCATVLGV